MQQRNVLLELKDVLSREYADYVQIVAKLTRRSKESVREALHEVSCRLLTIATERPSDLESVTAWRPYIVQAVVNELKEKRRQVARRKRTLVDFSDLDAAGRESLLSIMDPQPTPAEQAERNELVRIAFRELEALPPQERDVILRRLAGESFEHIARSLSIGLQTATGYAARGASLLRQRLKKAA